MGRTILLEDIGLSLGPERVVVVDRDPFPDPCRPVEEQALRLEYRGSYLQHHWEGADVEGHSGVGVSKGTVK